MNGFLTAMMVESRKATASRVTGTITLILLLGILALAAGFELGIRSGNAQITAQLGPLALLDGWPRMLGLVAQITAAGALLAFGVALSWLIGREFTDGTITGLFALPVTKPAIVLAKLAVYLAWVVAIALACVVVLVVVGLVLGLGLPDQEGISGLGRQFALVVLTGLVAVPAAWAATLGRGLLPGIAATIGLVICAQVMAVAGIGAWFPVAAPALWAIAPATVTPAQLALVATLPLIFGLLTLVSWSRLQLDR